MLQFDAELSQMILYVNHVIIIDLKDYIFIQ